jgi:hypothetical protein
MRVVVSAAIYCVADRRMFVGAVAVINSLRIVGHREPIFVLDCGLEEDQRKLLSREATLVTSRSQQTPHLSKCVLPLARPADAMLLIDADVIVTRSLLPLLQTAAEGKVVAFADALADRFDARWSELLDFGEPRRQPYVNSGIVALPRGLGSEVLEGLRSAAPRVDVGRSMVAQGNPEDPFYFLDQDVLNAILATAINEEDLVILEYRLAPHPPFPGVRVRDAASLQCAYDDGAEPFALHHIQRKPWLAAVRSTVYSRLLTRLLLAPDLPLRLQPHQLPVRLRTGTLASLDQRRAGLLAGWRRLRGHIGLRRRLRLRRGLRQAGTRSGI